MVKNQHIHNGKLYCGCTAVDEGYTITALSSLLSGSGNFESYSTSFHSTLNSVRHLVISCQDLAAHTGPLNNLPDENKSHLRALA